MDVDPGTRGVDPLTGNKTTVVPGSTITLNSDMNSAVAKLYKVAGQITEKQLDYRLQTVNSNSAGATAYNQVTGQLPPPAVQMPGSGLNILTGGRFPSPPPPRRELTK